MKRLIVVLAMMGALAACSSSSQHRSSASSRAATTGRGGQATSSSSPQDLKIYHDGFALPACNIGVAPAPCQRTVSPIEVQFATPTDVDHGGGYDVKSEGGSFTVTEYVDARPLEPCPSDDGYACMADDHDVTDAAGTWEIRG